MTVADFLSVPPLSSSHTFSVCPFVCLSLPVSLLHTDPII